MKKSGIWIDREKAVIITFKGSESEIKRLESQIETRERLEGEGNDSSRFGTQYINNETHKNNKIEEQTNQFFKKIDAELNQINEVILFGPADMKVKLEKHIRSNNQLSEKLEGVFSTDSMTENQMVAYVWEYYND